MTSTERSAASAVRVHEIRVHGVNNSPPAEMLETTPDRIEIVTGDGAGVFWRRKPADPTSAARPGGDSPDTRPDDGVFALEAYSWGGLSRTGGTALAAINAALVRVGWFLLLPYALVNLAYWTREIPSQRPAYKSWVGGTGAGVVRLFGLVLTLIAVAAFFAVSVDLVAVECFVNLPSPGGRVPDAGVCSPLPGVFDGLTGWSRDTRESVLGLVPLVILLVLYLIARRARVSFEPAVETFAGSIAGAGEAPLPLLSTPGFWAAARIRDTSEFLHLAAATFFTVFLLAFRAPFDDSWRAWFAIAAGLGVLVCGGVLVLATSTPDRSAAPPVPVETLPRIDRMLRRAREAVAKTGVGQVVSKAAAVTWNATPAVRTAGKRDAASWSLLVAGVLYALWAATEGLRAADVTDPLAFPPVSVPAVLIAVGVFLCLWALVWSRRSPTRTWGGFALLVFAGAALLDTQLTADDAVAGALTAVALLLVLGHLALCFWPLKKDGQGLPVARGETTAPRDIAFEAWHGRGAAVAMLLSLLASVSLSSLLVLGAWSWLGARPPLRTTELWRVPDPGLDHGVWAVPAAYAKNAVVLTAVVVVLVVLLAVVGLVLLVGKRSLRRLSLPPLVWGAWHGVAAGREAREDLESGFVEDPSVAGGGMPDDYPARFEGDVAKARALPPDPEDARDPGGSAARAMTRHVHADARARRRRLSGLMHRGEALGVWVVGVTAVGFLALSAPWLVQRIGLQLDAWWPGSTQLIEAVAMATLGAVAVGAVAAIVADAVTTKDRPLGTFWDVVGFLPRAGHPFAPPCFAERAVPELATRVRTILGVGEQTPPRDAVLLSAHSMGSTLSAATILALRGERDSAGRPLTHRIALLSFGSQLRGYFSRFFPSVLGCTVLGVPGLVGPSLWTADPWQRQVTAEFAAARKRAAESTGVAAALAPARVWTAATDVAEIASAAAAPVAGTDAAAATDGVAGADEPPAATVVATAAAASGGLPAGRPAAGAPADDAEEEVSLLQILTTDGNRPRWRNLWRRTDYLGFPVYGYPVRGNPIDVGASENAPGYLWRFATHGPYLGQPQFHISRQALTLSLQRTRS